MAAISVLIFSGLIYFLLSIVVANVNADAVLALADPACAGVMACTATAVVLVMTPVMGQRRDNVTRQVEVLEVRGCDHAKVTLAAVIVG
jgi:hypothetical protein